MMRNHHVLLSFIIFNSIVLSHSKLTIRTMVKHEKNLIQNKVLITILQNCDLGLKNIGIYGSTNKSIIFDIIKPSRPLFTSISTSDLNVQPTSIGHNIETQVIIVNRKISLQYDDTFRWWYNMLKTMVYKWTPSRNCSIFVILEHNNGCTFSQLNFLHFKRLYFFNVFFICIFDGRPVMYTYDPYGDSRSSVWKVMTRDIDFGNNWTVYRQFFSQDNICEGLLLDSRFPIRTANITIGITSSYMKNPYLFEEGKMYKYKRSKRMMNVDKQTLITALKKLLGIKVNFYMGQKSYSSFKQMNKNTSVDFFLSLMDGLDMRPWSMTLPIFYNDFTIISHNQGHMTPIEKIGNFYGRWTLISISVMSILIFIVIWFKIKKPYAACFDILRLLVNTSIFIPLDTLPLRIFFAMVFLYFLILQATFSGRIAEFLTKRQLRKNIDSINDLRNPRIKQIYNHGYIFQESEDLVNKSTIVYSLDECLQLMRKNKHSVCIGTQALIFNFLKLKNRKNKYYCSKTVSPALPIVMPLRHRFPLDEQLRQAVLYLTDIKISFHLLTEDSKRLETFLYRREVKWQIKFRPITLKDLYFAFIFFVTGMTLGCMCFLLEVLINLNIKKCVLRQLKKKKFFSLWGFKH